MRAALTSQQPGWAFSRDNRSPGRQHVLPLHVCDDLFLGVLDIDSPIENRFDELDLQGLEKIIRLLTSPLQKLMGNP